MVKVSYDMYTPRIKSQDDESLRADMPHWKPPVPNEEWRDSWGPRKRFIKRASIEHREVAISALEEALGLSFEAGEIDFPRNEQGRVVKSDELLEALCMFLSSGGLRATFAKALDIPRSTLSSWMNSREWRDRVRIAESEGYDSMAEDVLTIASQPLILEEEFLSYSATGELIRRDVKRSDAVQARKLAASTRLDLLKKWAPERYGDKIEVQTTASLSEQILAARKRVGGVKPDDDSE